jgi:putative DNA primase/helicase
MNINLDGLNIIPEEFLRPFFEQHEVVNFRVFADKKGDVFSGQKYERQLDKYFTLDEELRRHNEQTRGIFFVINFGGQSDADITRINAQFMECDDLAFDEQIARISAFPLEPSIIVKTRKSLHCYWLVRNADVSKFRYVQKQLVAQFGADPNCINESRVFRLPSFFHCKEEPVQVQVVKFNPELRYTQDELSKALPSIAESPIAVGKNGLENQGVQVAHAPPVQVGLPSNYGSQKGISLVGRRCAFINFCHKNAKNLSEPLWYAMISNLAVFEGGVEKIHLLSSKYQRYNYEATNQKIAHFFDSGTKPMSCQTIANKGFICPRMGKDCKCHAPAGLAFFTPTPAELDKFLATIKVSTNPTENAVFAQKFISDYLFSVESTVGEMFINHNIRDCFHWKVSDMKPLLAYYKQINSVFQSEKETMRKRETGELPPWYTLTDKGQLRFWSSVLADFMAENIPALFVAEKFYIYENGVYAAATDRKARRNIREKMNNQTRTSSQISDTAEQWEMITEMPIREINPNPYLLNLKNGMYNFYEDAFLPHHPKFLSTVQIKANYNPAAKCEMFMSFLERVLDAPEIILLQEIIGYLLVPITKAQKAFILLGVGYSGKSTLLSIINENLLGTDNVSNITLQDLSEKFKPVELFGKLANVFSDLPPKPLTDSSMFKSLTGEDYITGERKNKDPFSFRPYARLIFSCNDIPKNYGDRSEAFYRRLIIMRFSKAIPKADRDPHLKDRLATEIDGIFMWALVGLKRLMQNNWQFTETDATQSELNLYKNDNNNALSFINENCEFEIKAEILCQELYDSYKSFCIDNGNKPYAVQRFKKEIESLPSVSYSRDAVTRRHTWRGIRLI